MERRIRMKYFYDDDEKWEKAKSLMDEKIRLEIDDSFDSLHSYCIDDDPAGRRGYLKLYLDKDIQFVKRIQNLPESVREELGIDEYDIEMMDDLSCEEI